MPHYKHGPRIGEWRGGNPMLKEKPAPKSRCLYCTTPEPPDWPKPDESEPRRAERGTWNVGSDVESARPEPKTRTRRGAWNVSAERRQPGSVPAAQ